MISQARSRDCGECGRHAVGRPGAAERMNFGLHALQSCEFMRLCRKSNEDIGCKEVMRELGGLKSTCFGPTEVADSG